MSLIVFCGVSCAGKTTLMRALSRSYGWNFIRVATTRQIRPGESEKFHISLHEFKESERRGNFLKVNYVFGQYYGTLLEDIELSAERGGVYMLDWPIGLIDGIWEYADHIFIIMLKSESQLLWQIRKSGRSERISSILREYRSDYNNESLAMIAARGNAKVSILVNEPNGGDGVMEEICRRTLKKI